MKNYIVCTIVVVLFYSCAKTNPKEYTQYLDGYWEIDKVITIDGVEKQYKFNPSIDFFEVKDTIGIRKKVQPQLDGSFIVMQDSETFSIQIEQDSLRLYYKTPIAHWKETLISAKENQIIIKTESGNLYFYKPYEKLKL